MKVNVLCSYHLRYHHQRHNSDDFTARTGSSRCLRSMQNHTAAIKRHKAALYNGTNNGEVCKIQVRYRSDVCTPRYPSHIKRGKIVLCVTESLWRVTLVLSGRGMRRRTISDIYTVSLVSVCLLDFEPCEYITFSKQELKFKM